MKAWINTAIRARLFGWLLSAIRKRSFPSLSLV